MADTAEGAKGAHYPSFIVEPGTPDYLFGFVVVFVLVLVFVIGALYFRLHALPEHMAHDTNRSQFQLVAILALVALFTHNNLFWIAALLLAAVQLPDFMTPLRTIATSLEKIAGSNGGASNTTPPTEPIAEPRHDDRW